MPIRFQGNSDVAMKRLRQVVQQMPRTTVVNSTDMYLHAESASRVFRFIDDIEFLIDPDRREINFRSASRVGYSDLGVNRERMERIRDQFESGVK